MSLIVFQFLLQIIWILRILYQVIDSKIPVVNLDSSLCAGRPYLWTFKVSVIANVKLWILYMQLCLKIIIYYALKIYLCVILVISIYHKFVIIGGYKGWRRGRSKKSPKTVTLIAFSTYFVIRSIMHLWEEYSCHILMKWSINGHFDQVPQYLNIRWKEALVWQLLLIWEIRILDILVIYANFLKVDMSIY